MRLKSIYAQNVPPVKLFQINDLSDVVIIAGPNGVGKSRLLQSLLTFVQNPTRNTQTHNFKLIVEATCKEESQSWGKSFLDTTNNADAELLKETLQQNKRRGHWKSGVLFFESDRSLQQVQPFAFTWEFADPYEENIGWNSTFGGIKSRYQDTVHSIFKIIEHQKRGIANMAIRLKSEGKTAMNLEFEDPIAIFKDAFSQLLSPKKLLNPSAQTQQLEYEYQGKTFNISNLSSGEREVVNIVFDFLLRKPDNCIVVFDEPELHLHPELSYKLIQTLKSVGENNQFIFCTHSPDLISSSLDNSVIFLAPPKDDLFNQAVSVSEEDETNQALKLLGHSIGIVALGKKIVLIEGRESSLDKQVYGTLIKNKYPGLVLVPTGSKDEIKSFSSIFDKVLSRTIWGVNFFMLTDRDTLPLLPELDTIKHNSERFRLLKKYHLENYFLNENIWSEIFAEMEPADSWLTDPIKIRSKFKEYASESISYAVSLFISALIRTKIGNIDIMPKDCQNKSLEEIKLKLIEESKTELDRVRLNMLEEVISDDSKQLYNRLENSLNQDTEDWKDIIPGRPILHRFAAVTKLPIGRAKQLYLRMSERNGHNTFGDIFNIFEHFNNL